MESVVLRDLWGPDLHKGFFETLAALRKIELTPERASEILRRRLAAGIRTIVAVLGDRIVGTASYIVEEKFYGKVSHVEDVAVHPQFMGHGIGQSMIREVIARSKDAVRMGSINMPFWLPHPEKVLNRSCGGRVGSWVARPAKAFTKSPALG